MSNRLYFVGLRHARPISIALAAFTASASLVAPAKADPPVGLPLFCFRFTDVKQVGALADNNFQFEFEILNWTSQYANRLTVNFPISGTTTASGSPLNNGVNVTTAFIDPDGRRLPPGPVQPIPGNVSPTNNNWSTTFLNTFSGPFSVKSAIYDAGTPIPNIDVTSILATSATPQQAVAKVNALNPPGGHFPNRDFNPFDDVETIDNGTNVLDGFAFEAHSFDPGDYLVYEWLLAPDVQSPGGNGVGILARGIPVQGNFINPVNGFQGTGPTVSNLTLFAPGSPPVGSEYGFYGVLGAGVGGLNNISDVTPVPAPVPALGATMALGYARKLRKRCRRLQDAKAASASD